LHARTSEVTMHDDFGGFEGETEPAAGPPHQDPAPARRPRRAIAVVVTAVVAATIGFLVATAVRDTSAGPAAASSSPSAAAPSGGAQEPGSGGAAPNGGAIPTPGPGQLLQLQIGGKVAAVSATSITITAGSQQVRAAVTSSTRVTGRVTSIAGVKTGDLVAAQITDAGGKLTATAIQDPSSLP
jgi:hypothetical protein